MTFSPMLRWGYGTMQGASSIAPDRPAPCVDEGRQLTVVGGGQRDIWHHHIGEEPEEKIVASEHAPMEENRPEGNRPDDEFTFIDQSQPPERLPIFPLPNVLLFPNMVLPLHIFEERYKRMVSDCLQGDRLLGLFLLQYGWEQEGASPTPYEVGGMGRITRAVRFPNGSMDILLSGLARVRILRYVQHKPYLIAEVEMWPDEPDDSEGVEALTRRMVGLFERFVIAKAGEGHELLTGLKLLASPIDLLHYVVTNMPLDVHQKQEIINLRPIDERITMMITFLNRELSAQK
jgi:Lon protease-like protein